MTNLFMHPACGVAFTQPCPCIHQPSCLCPTSAVANCRPSPSHYYYAAKPSMAYGVSGQSSRPNSRPKHPHRGRNDGSNSKFPSPPNRSSDRPHRRRRPSTGRSDSETPRANKTPPIISDRFPGDDPRAPIPPELPPAKFEEDDFEGFRPEDDAFWDHFRVQSVAFRATTCLTADMLKDPEPQLDRDGQPPKYPAALQYDFEKKKWVPTTEDEERRLREPNPVYDPFFIPVAQPGEQHTTLRPLPPNRYMDESDPNKIHVRHFDKPFDKSSDLTAHRRKPLDMKPAAWRVVHLGTSSALPTRKRNVSSTAVLLDKRSLPPKSSQNQDKTKGMQSDIDTSPSMFLVDVGENTESRLIHCDWCMTHGFRWIKAIFITHLHGDHIYGLPKLLWAIGQYTQYRRRIALENGEDGSDPVIRIFGPYGTRGFIRASLHWTRPLGVRFSVSELTPRPTDFLHLHGYNQRESEPQIIVHNPATGDVSMGSGLDLKKSCPPPLDEEVRAEDVAVSEDGLWHVWEETYDDGRVVEVVSAPLKHRMPCFGYVFRERNADVQDDGSEETPDESQTKSKNRVITVLGDTCDSSEIAEAAQNSELLVHEATFAMNQADKARIAMHSTAYMAGAFGREIQAKKIALTHFSSRYEALLMDDENSANMKHQNMQANSRRERGGGGFVLVDEEDEDMIFATEKEEQEESEENEAATEGAHGDDVEDVFGVFIPAEQGREMRDVLDEFDDMIHGDSKVRDDNDDSDDDEDYVSVNLLVREAYDGYGGGSKGVEIIAAHDFMEHDVLCYQH